MTIDGETAADVDAVRAVLMEAFGQPSEADLVDALRRANALKISLAARMDDGVAGHIAFSAVTLGGNAPATLGLGLAPRRFCRLISGRGSVLR